MVDGETGFLVPTRDHEAMAARIVQLLKNPTLRARMGEAALERARERFTVERMVDGTQAMYETHRCSAQEKSQLRSRSRRSRNRRSGSCLASAKRPGVRLARIGDFSQTPTQLGSR